MKSTVMRKIKNITINNFQIKILEFGLIVTSAILPIFFNVNYTSKIYLAWEGAYRLYLGQIPFKDFSLPMGFGSWIIPAFFFGIFGPFLSTLIKAQAFINIVSAIAFRSILQQVQIKPGIRLLSVLLYIISFSFFNIWPWYDHTVIVFEFVGLAFLLRYIMNDKKRRVGVYLFLSAFFIFLSFFTKQDAGGLSLAIALVLISYHSVYERNLRGVLWFLFFFILVGTCFFLPFIPYNIGYWFNYGQPPHNARLSLLDFLNAIFGKSQWIKFYTLILAIIFLIKLEKVKNILKDKKFVVFTLLVVGILIESTIIQVTSFTTPLNNVFLHSFVIAYIFSFLDIPKYISFNKLINLLVISVFILFWWSSILWPQMSKVVIKYLPSQKNNEISVSTFIRSDPHTSWAKSQTVNLANWKNPSWNAFRGIKMPSSTIDGIERLLNNPVIKNQDREIRVLNMTELTPLAEVIGYKPETGIDIPLWYHKNVGMFEKQIEEYMVKIRNDHYDLVLFEYIPIYNNFYPFEIRDLLKEEYHQIDTFPAPRDLYYRQIEVYVKNSQK